MFWTLIENCIGNISSSQYITKIKPHMVNELEFQKFIEVLIILQNRSHKKTNTEAYILHIQDESFHLYRNNNVVIHVNIPALN